MDVKSIRRSGEKRFLWLLLLAVLGLGLIVWAVSRPKPVPDPLVKGRPVSTWALDLNSPVAETRDRATKTIQAHMDSSAVPALVHLLRTPDPALAKLARAACPRLPTKLSQALLRIINPADGASKRSAAVQALRIMGPQASGAVPALSAALTDDSTVAWYAAVTLAEFGERGTRALTNALTSTSPTQRGYICYALGTQGWAASNAVPALIAVVEQAEPPASETASSALGKLGPAAVPALKDACTNANPYVRLLAVNALTRLGPIARAALTNLIEVAHADDPSLRAAALDGLAQVQAYAPQARDCFLQAVADPSREVRLKALQGLARTRSSDLVINAMVQLSKDESANVRAEAATLLGEMTAATNLTIPALLASAQDPNDAVRRKARAALQHLHYTNSP